MKHDFAQAGQPPPATTQQPPPRPSREELQQQLQDVIQAAKDAALGAQAEQQAVTVQPPLSPFGPIPDPDVPENVLILVVVLAALSAATLIFRPLMLALGRRFERRGNPPSEAPDLAPRLDRIEQAIEAIAVEVERISEGQRYVTKQMHELRALPAPNPLAQPAMAQRAPEMVRRGEPSGGGGDGGGA